MEWVDVSERLPEDCIPVLVKGVSDNAHRKGYDVCWRNAGVWTSWFVSEITHWMSLPELPRE